MIYDYEAPINAIVSELETKMEDDCLKAVKSYGFEIDKEELAKALKYDRGQYERGYKQGRADLYTKIKEFPIRRNHYDKEHGSVDFISGIEIVMEYIDALMESEGTK